MQRAMILAAGLGTRLRPLTEQLAKPMVPIGDRPAIEHVWERLQGAARIVVNVHHRPEDVEAWARGHDVTVSREPVLLGTAGGVANAAALLGEGDVVIWNADILCALDPSILEGDAFGSLAVTPSENGNVGVAADGTIVRLRKESVAPEAWSGNFLGIHRISGSARKSLPKQGCLIGDVYIPAMRAGERLTAVRTDEPFVDVGSIDQYLLANRRWLGARKSWAHPTATIAGSIDGAVSGACAKIDADWTNCVVWPGAHVVDRAHGLVLSGPRPEA